MTTSDGTVVLLDANLLIALVVEDHIHHDLAERWSMSQTNAFATCPITQGSLVRFLVREGTTAREAQRLVAAIAADDRHQFWADDLGYEDVALDASSVTGRSPMRTSWDSHGPTPADWPRWIGAWPPCILVSPTS